MQNEKSKRMESNVERMILGTQPTKRGSIAIYAPGNWPLIGISEFALALRNESQTRHRKRLSASNQVSPQEANLPKLVHRAVE
jgi:hypothetical protein